MQKSGVANVVSLGTTQIKLYYKWKRKKAAKEEYSYSRAGVQNPLPAVRGATLCSPQGSQLVQKCSGGGAVVAIAAPQFPDLWETLQAG